MQLPRMSCCGTDWVGIDRAHCCRRTGGCGHVFDDAQLWDAHRPARGLCGPTLCGAGANQQRDLAAGTGPGTHQQPASGDEKLTDCAANPEAVTAHTAASSQVWSQRPHRRSTSGTGRLRTSSQSPPSCRGVRSGSASLVTTGHPRCCAQRTTCATATSRPDRPHCCDERCQGAPRL